MKKIILMPFAAVVALSLTGCGDEASAGSAFRTKFLEACLASPNLNQAICDCSVEKLEAYYSAAELENVALTGRAPARFDEVSAQAGFECALKINR